MISSLRDPRVLAIAWVICALGSVQLGELGIMPTPLAWGLAAAMLARAGYLGLKAWRQRGNNGNDEAG